MKYIPILLMLTFITFLACQTAPSRIAGESESCYQFRDCMYRNKDNPDKSICKDFGAECRAYSRFEYCKEEKNRPADMRFQECWDKLNTK